MDRRFCALCNRATAPAAGDLTLADVLRFLNEARVRATYGAVATVLGVPPRALGALLGDRRPEASWVVNGETGLPTGYEQTEWHPDLLASSAIIRASNELTLRIALWRSTASPPR
jgi:hypothetical protein